MVPSAHNGQLTVGSIGIIREAGAADGPLASGERAALNAFD
jgi:hypothetical protein